MAARSSGSVSFSSFVSTWRKKRTVGLSSSPNSITCTIKREHYKMLRAVHADKAGRWPNRNTHLKYGERETLPLEEVGDQLDQVVEHYAGQVGQLLELVPQAELESHLLQIWGQDYWTWANHQNANKTEAARGQFIQAGSSLHVKGKHSGRLCLELFDGDNGSSVCQLLIRTHGLHESLNRKCRHPPPHQSHC